MYRYYVTYQFTDTHGGGSGWAHVAWPTPLTANDFPDVGRVIADANHFDTVAVLTASRLEEPA